MAPSGVEVKTYAGLDETAALFQEKLDRLRKEIGSAEKELSVAQQQVDARQEEVGKLDRAIASKTKEIATLSDQATNGKEELETHRKKILATLAEREEKANARVNAAETAEAKAQATLNAATQQRQTVAGFKTDIVKTLERLHAQMGALVKQAQSDLSDVK